jgi:hypothetical protein
MVLRKGDGGLIKRMDLKAGIDIAGKGKERLPFGQIGKIVETLDIQLRQLGRNMHQLAQLLGAQISSRLRQIESLLREMRV